MARAVGHVVVHPWIDRDRLLGGVRVPPAPAGAVAGGGQLGYVTASGARLVHAVGGRGGIPQKGLALAVASGTRRGFIPGTGRPGGRGGKRAIAAADVARGASDRRRPVRND
eukprot:scaffold74894_cov34-Phaeocystis_antarctica.AAC.1